MKPRPGNEETTVDKTIIVLVVRSIDFMAPVANCMLVYLDYAIPLYTFVTGELSDPK